ncbi:MAG TPA: response regulator [Candidatus Aquilonibacter sp.]
MARILIVDDDPNARLLVRTVLEYAGHDVLEASDAVQGHALLVGERPDLTMVDLSLPGTGGAQWIAMVRKDPRLQAARIALYTATRPDAALTDFMEIYRLCGAIPKPSEPAELLAAVQAALSEAPASN